MTDIPKIVHHRLRGPAAERTHPEADLLTAFAEQALSATEREDVLQHLALCADCREVIALALPAAELARVLVEPQGEVATTPDPTQVPTNRFAWANLGWAQLRWATLAAGIAVAVLLMRPGLDQVKKPSQPVSSVASQSPASAPPASAAQVASASIAKAKAENSVRAKTTTPEQRLDFASNGPQVTVPSPQSDVRTMVARNLDKKAAPASNLSVRNKFAASAAKSRRAPGEAFETVVVSPSDSTAADKTAADNLMARADAPAIEKAKPPLKDSETAYESQNTGMQKAMASPSQPQPTLQAKGGMVALVAAAPAVIPPKQNANWAIADGVLQRSFDNGQTWQTAVRADHALLCYANRGNEVWAGGQAGTLMHSTDGGTTWSAVTVSFQAYALSADVIRIDVRSPAEIALATGTHETWSSADGGKTWEKK